MVSLVLVAIAFIDIRHHRIPHWTLLLLSIAIFLEDGFNFNPKSGLLLFLLATLFVLTAKLGMGDLKLLVLLGVTSLQWNAVGRFLWLLAIASLLLSALHILRNRSLSGNIALAPAIVSAFLFI